MASPSVVPIPLRLLCLQSTVGERPHMLQCQVRDGGVVLPASLEQFSDCMAMAADALRQPLNSSDKQEIEDFVLVIYKSTLKNPSAIYDSTQAVNSLYETPLTDSRQALPRTPLVGKSAPSAVNSARPDLQSTAGGVAASKPPYESVLARDPSSESEDTVNGKTETELLPSTEEQSHQLAEPATPALDGLSLKEVAEHIHSIDDRVAALAATYKSLSPLLSRKSTIDSFQEQLRSLEVKLTKSANKHKNLECHFNKLLNRHNDLENDVNKLRGDHDILETDAERNHNTLLASIILIESTQKRTVFLLEKHSQTVARLSEQFRGLEVGVNGSDDITLVNEEH